MYPLLVACKSQSTSRRAAAMAVVDNVRLHSATLVQQAQLVSVSCLLPGCALLTPSSTRIASAASCGWCHGSKQSAVCGAHQLTRFNGNPPQHAHPQHCQGC